MPSYRYRTLLIFSNVWLFIKRTYKWNSYRTLLIFSNVWPFMNQCRKMQSYRTLLIFSNVWLMYLFVLIFFSYRTLLIFSNVWHDTLKFTDFLHFILPFTIVLIFCSELSPKKKKWELWILFNNDNKELTKV